MTPAGIEPATFWFVAQHLNHCATAFLAFKKRITDHISQSAAPSVVLNMLNAKKQA